MPMNYPCVAIRDSEIPRASSAVFQHLLDAYASETNKVISVWRCFSAADLSYKPHPRSRPVLDIFKHQLLSERRFLLNFSEHRSPLHRKCCPNLRCLTSTSIACASWRFRAWHSLHDKRLGGCRRCRSLMSFDSASGSSGDACCIPAIIVRS